MRVEALGTVLLTEGDFAGVEDIHDAVDAFVADGSITNRGIGNALHAFLNQIAAAIFDGDNAFDLYCQLFFAVFTNTLVKTCCTSLLLHLGQRTVFVPCSEIFSIRWNLCPQFLHA